MEFRLEGSGINGYYSPATYGVMNPPATPVACSVTPTPNPTPTPTGSKPAIPTDGQRYFILGQDQVSIQGYTAQSDLPRPHGLTMYATLSRGERSYDGSYCFKGLDGLKNLGNYNSNSASGCHDNGHRQSQWGSGVQNVQWAIETYNPEIMAIGLWCPNNGAYDDLLTELADFFKQYQSTKFLLRTCYEFNGDAGGWSDVNFRNTFKYVRTFLYVPEYCGTVSVAYMAIQPLYYAPQMAEGAARRRALAADLFAQGLR